MAELHYKDGGTWRKAKELHYKDGGTWRKLKEVWYRDAGVWRRVHSGIGVPALSNRSFGGGEVTAICRFNNDGTLSFEDDSSSPVITGEWLSSSPGTFSSSEAGAWDVMFTYVSGPNPTSGGANTGGATKSGAAYGAWLNLSSTRQINVGAYMGLITGTGGGTLVFDAAIRPAGGGATLATGRITLVCSI
jgi:hypothetical protein